VAGPTGAYPGPVSRLSAVADVPALVRALATTDPTRPRLTWYGPAGERIELSGKVLDNWVAKTANLLVHELDAGPGSRVALDLPAHWRTAVWLLACWSAGCCAVLPGPDGTTDGDVAVLVTDRPGSEAARAAGADGAELVAVALPGLAMAFGPDLPAGALDAAIEVRSQGDVFVPPVRPAAGDPAVELPGVGPVGHAVLLDRARDAGRRLDLEPGVRLLTGAGPDRCLAGLLAPLLLDGSVVLHHDLAGLAADAATDLTAQEQVTRTWP
jgi:uncharacterized protein (TIGR03089 family)